MGVGESGRLVILSGPSCMGKTPLCRSLGKSYPELHNEFHKLVLFNSRDPRPGEINGVELSRRAERIKQLGQELDRIGRTAITEKPFGRAS